jgi:hypothetical protein
MHSASASPSDDWWPDLLSDIAIARPFDQDPVVVAEISGTAAEVDTYWQVFTALAPVRDLTAILEHRGGIGFRVESSGPHPAQTRGQWDYTPRFWVDAGSTAPERLEPLVLSWADANRSVLWPDQGFLMTYGLLPRLVREGAVERIHWDAPSIPRPDVVVVEPVSTYSWGAHTGGRVTVAREVLQDYATIRGQALVQVYYAQRSGEPTDDLAALLGNEKSTQFELKGRLFDIRYIEGPRLLAQVWGVRLLAMPSEAPLSAGQWDFGALTWPGWTEPITSERAQRLGYMDVAYVRDSVLARYETPEFEIHPESGSVSYGNQWSVSPTWRVGRDVIAVDLKKLYEGNRSETVRHWHAHAVDPPAGGLAGRKQPNVGARSRQIVYALTSLGDVLADLGSILPQPPRPLAFVGQERRQLDYSGWFKGPQVEPITRHIPTTMSRDHFLTRCGDLNKLVNEGLQQAPLRRLLIAMTFPSESIANLRSLALLDQLSKLADVAVSTGLSLRNDCVELHTRILEQAPSSRIDRLSSLNELRQLGGHASDGSFTMRFRGALRHFDLDPQAYASGWGLALDSVYDGVGKTLEDVAQTLAIAAR